MGLLSSSSTARAASLTTPGGTRKEQNYSLHLTVMTAPYLWRPGALISLLQPGPGEAATPKVRTCPTLHPGAASRSSEEMVVQVALTL